MKRNVNWHKAAICALQITLRASSHLLDYYPEYPLGKNNYRIDLLLIKKHSPEKLQQTIGQIFQIYNLFEIKGIGSTLTATAYYKTIGYAGLFLASLKESCSISRNHISLSFLCQRYPQKLLKHLSKDCQLTIENSVPGVYYIKGDIFPTQILVTQELSPDENLYLKCLTNHLANDSLINQLFNDYSHNQGIEAYENYMQQLKNTLITAKEDSFMCGEWIFELCGTSSKEVAEKAVAEANAKTNAIIAEKDATIASLKALLAAHGIPTE